MISIVRRCLLASGGEGERLRLLSNSLLNNDPWLYHQQIRGRKRALRSQLTRQQKIEKRMKREEKIAERKKFGFMERIKIARMRSEQSQSQQGPGRLVREDEAHLPDRPTTNVFLRNKIKTQFYSIIDALNLHRQLQQPAIHNNPDAPIRLRLELNMTTERSSKMLGQSNHLIPVQFPFTHGEKRSILVFVKNERLQEQAIEAGAEIAVGPEVVKKIMKGQFRVDEYDFCISHSDCASAILPLRGLLKSRFPTRLNGGLGDELAEMIENFRNGIKLDVKPDSVFPHWGLTNAIVGRLEMSDDHIEANIATIIGSLCKLRNPALGPFVNRALLMTVPGEAHFAINIDHFLPEVTEADEEKVEKYKKKKKKKAATREEDEQEEEQLTESIGASS